MVPISADVNRLIVDGLVDGDVHAIHTTHTLVKLVATKIIEKGTYVSNFGGLVLEPDACKAFFEKAHAHRDDPDLGRT